MDQTFDATVIEQVIKVQDAETGESFELPKNSTFQTIKEMTQPRQPNKFPVLYYYLGGMKVTVLDDEGLELALEIGYTNFEFEIKDMVLW